MLGTGRDDAVRHTERMITPASIARQDLLASMARSGDLHAVASLAIYDAAIQQWRCVDIFGAQNNTELFKASKDHGLLP